MDEQHVGLILSVETTPQWESFRSPWPVKLDDRTWAFPATPLMRRRDNGKWLYRRLTEIEMKEFLSSDAW